MTFLPDFSLSISQTNRDRGLKDKLIAGKYNPADIPLSSKDGATCGMSMTEKQGGSDVRANTTQATPVVPGKEASGGGGVLEGKFGELGEASDGSETSCSCLHFTFGKLV